MQCAKWEGDGLLYCAGELSTDESQAYEAHVLSCEECSREIRDYREMFGDFAVRDLLEEIPSPECDQKVIEAMAKQAKSVQPKVVMPGFFAMIMHRIAIPAAIFAFAVTIGIQFSNKTNTNKGVVAESIDSSESSKDTLHDTGRVFREGTSTGAIPVTLEE